MALPIAAGLAGFILAGLASGVGQIVAKTLISLGVGYITYTGMQALLDLNSGQIFTLLGTLPPVTIQILGVLKVGTCINIWFSALAMKVSLMGFNSDAMTKMRVVGAGS
jgi:hypothetical protein